MSLELAPLRKALGRAAVKTHDAFEVDGHKLELTLRPANADALAGALWVLNEARAGVLVAGGGTQLALGNPPRRADAILSTDRLDAIDELDADEGVVHAGAGVTLAKLRKRAAKAGWDLPVESPHPDATLGGALAAAACGPRVQRFGPPRDHVLGLEVALATGELTRCGGRVVKNVTGYDLMKLHIGALGTLGVIAGAWLRLRPAPRETALLRCWLPEDDAGFAAAARASAAVGARCAALVDPALASRVDESGPEKGRRLLVVELAGAPAEVARGRSELAAAGEFEKAPDAVLARLAAAQATPDPASGLRFRLALRPRRLAVACAHLARAGATLLAYPGPGLVHAGFPLFEGADTNTVDAALRAAREAARAGGGSAVLESAPSWAKAGRDVFGEPPEALPLYRALKQQFDPHAVLNPGRFVGSL